MFQKIKYLFYKLLYGQGKKPIKGLIKGKEVLIRNSNKRKYPVPCNSCNMILQDEAISFKGLEDDGLVFFEKDSNNETEEMKQLYHLPSCPEVHKVMSYKQGLAL